MEPIGARVPHFLPGQNTALGDLLKNEPWVPEAAVRGGVAVYPEYKAALADPAAARTLRVPSSKSAVAVEKSIADQSPKDGQVHVLPVQGNVFMLVADGVDLTASVGGEGVLVNTGAAMSDKDARGARPVGQRHGDTADGQLLRRRQLPRPRGMVSPYINAVTASPGSPKPLRFIMNTSANAEHVGGNESCRRPDSSRARPPLAPPSPPRAEGVDRRARTC